MTQLAVVRLKPLLDRLGNAFTVADVMIPKEKVRAVPTGDLAAAEELVLQWRYSAIPTVSVNNDSYHSIFETAQHGESRAVTGERILKLDDFLPERTPLSEAVEYFHEREWYLTLRGNRVSGMVTYWDFNAREFRIQLFVALSQIEELSRDILAQDGCGMSDASGLNLSNDDLRRARGLFNKARERLGGNRFVDVLGFREVQEAVERHEPWRAFLGQRVGERSAPEQETSGLNALRNLVMHGGPLFNTHPEFLKTLKDVEYMLELVGHLAEYRFRA